MDYKQIAALISKSKKKTPSKVYVCGGFQPKDFEGCGFQAFGEGRFWILIGDLPLIEKWIEKNKVRVKDHHIEVTARYSALPLLDLRKVEARIEPGAVIREGALIGKDCVIMMGAVINIGAEIGQNTMVDMNAVIGARAIVGKNCHIGAGAVIAGVLEPPSKTPVVIEDHVLVGANASVLEGVRVGRGSVVGAGSVVREDVPPGMVVAGVPAREIRKVSEIKDREKVSIIKSLRRRR